MTNKFISCSKTSGVVWRQLLVTLRTAEVVVGVEEGRRGTLNLFVLGLDGCGLVGLANVLEVLEVELSGSVLRWSRFADAQLAHSVGQGGVLLELTVVVSWEQVGRFRMLRSQGRMVVATVNVTVQFLHWSRGTVRTIHPLWSEILMRLQSLRSVLRVVRGSFGVIVLQEQVVGVAVAGRLLFVDHVAY